MSGSGGSVPTGTGDGPHREQILHVRENSDSTMDELFNVINNPTPKNPLSKRKLPPSFFTPPTPPNHSRENSADSSFPGRHTRPSHKKTLSSPELSNNLSVQPTAPNHRPQLSLDFTIRENTSQWPSSDVRTSISSSFIPSNGGQWQQIRESVSSGSLVEQNSTLSPESSHGPSPSTSLQNLSLSSLPHGWDMSVTPDGEVYFINHMNKTTSWYHPNIAKQHQGPGPIKLSQLPVTLQQQLLQSQQQQQLAQQAGMVGSGSIHTQPAPILSGSIQQPAQAEQHIYMELLRLQKEKERLQREQEEIARKERQLQRNFGGSPGSATSTIVTGQQTTSPPLSIIEESPANAVNRPFQELMLKDMISGTEQSTSSSLALQPSTSGLDPFLGQPPANTSDSHARQNSADSGLGGMGTNYSLPRTPEDFLSNVDEMDSSDSGQKSVIKQGMSSDFNMNDMQGPTNMDIGVLNESENSNAMVGDDLVPSLQEDIMSSELLNDMELQKDLLLNQTWL